MLIMASLMDLRTLMLLSLLVLTQTMPTNRNKRELVNSEEAESAEISSYSSVQNGPPPEEDESPEDAGNDVVVDAPADFGQLGGDGQNAFTLSLRDDVNNVTMELVTLVFTEDENGQSSAEGVALGTGPSSNTGPGSVSSSQEGNSIQTGVSSESVSQESAEASLQGVKTDLVSVSSSLSVSLERSSDSSQVSSESSSSSASLSVELTSNSIEVSAEPQNLSTDPGSVSSSQESAEGSLHSLTTGVPSEPSAAPTEGAQPEEEETDEDDVDEDDVDEDDEEEVEPPPPTSPPPSASPTGSAADASLAPEMKDPYSGGVSGEPMLADQPMDIQVGHGVSADTNDMLTAEAALMQLYGDGIDGENNIVNQALDIPAADQKPQHQSLPDNSNTDPGTASINQEVTEASQQSLNTDLLLDPSAASTTQSPQPDATTAAAEEEGDEDDVDEDEAEEDDEDETGGEVTPSIVTPEVSPTISAAPPIPVLPTGNAADASVMPSGIAIDTAAVDVLENDPLLDMEGFVGDDPLSYAADQADPKNVHTDKHTLADTGLTSELNSVPQATDPGTAPVNQETAEASQADPSAASARLSPQPDATTAAAEEEGDEDDVDEDEVEEDDEDETGGEVTVAPTISASPAVPVVPTGNAGDASIAPAGLSMDAALAPQLKDPCADPGCGLNSDPLLDTEGFVGDDHQSYTVDQIEHDSQNTQTETFKDKQPLTDAPAGLTSELNSVPESPSVSTNDLAAVEVPSNMPQISPDTQIMNADPGTAPVNQETAEASQADPSAASATLSPQPDATTAAPEEEGDEDDVDEDEVEEDDEDETGGEVTPSIVTPEVSPTISAAPPISVLPTGNAADASVMPSGIAVDTAAVDVLENDPLLDMEGFVGDDPLSYAADQADPKNVHTDKHTLADTGLTSELNSVPESPSVSTNDLAAVEVPSNMPQISPDTQIMNADPGTAPVNQETAEASQADPSAASATQSPQPDATTAAPEEEGDEDDVDEDEVEEDDEDETGGEVTPSIVTPEVSPTISAAPPIPVLPTGNAADASVPPSGVAADAAVALQLNDPLLDTEGYLGDDPQSYTTDLLAPASKYTQTNTLTDKQALLDTPAGLISDLNSIPVALGISSTAATSVEILVLPSNIIEIDIEFESPNSGPGPAVSSQESVEAGPQSLITDLPSEPSGVPATQAPQPDPTTAAAEEEDKDEDEDEDEDEAVVANPSAVSLPAGPLSDTLSLSSSAAVSEEAPSDSSQVSAESSLTTLVLAEDTLPVDASVSVETLSDSSQVGTEHSSVSVELPVNSLEVSAESAQLPSDPSAAAPATTDPPPTLASPEEDDADEDDEDEHETGGATQVPPALVQAEALSVSSSASVSAEAPSDNSQISFEPIPSSAAASLELPLNSSEISAESAVIASVSVGLPLNSANVNTELAPPQTVLVSISIEANADPGVNPPSAPNPASAVQSGPGAGVVVIETALTSSEERLVEQEKAELASNAASDLQGNAEIAVANPWTEFLRSLGTRTPPQAPQQRSQSISRLSAPKMGITKPLPAVAAQSSSEEN